MWKAVTFLPRSKFRILWFNNRNWWLHRHLIQHEKALCFSVRLSWGGEPKSWQVSKGGNEFQIQHFVFKCNCFFLIDAKNSERMQCPLTNCTSALIEETAIVLLSARAIYMLLCRTLFFIMLVFHLRKIVIHFIIMKLSSFLTFLCIPSIIFQDFLDLIQRDLWTSRLKKLIL